MFNFSTFGKTFHVKCFLGTSDELNTILLLSCCTLGIIFSLTVGSSPDLGYWWQKLISGSCLTDSCKTTIRNYITSFQMNRSCLSWFKMILHTSFILYNKLHDRHPLSILVFPQTSIISSIFRCYLRITLMNIEY